MYDKGVCHESIVYRRICYGRTTRISCATSIADSVLDECISHDALSRVACEVLATKGQIIVAGEITSLYEPQIPAIARSVLQKVGYDPARYAIQCLIHKQSPDIAARGGLFR